MSGNRKVRHFTMSDTAVGPLTIVGDGTAVIGIYMNAHRHAPDVAAFGEVDSGDEVLRAAVAQLEQYFKGTRTQFDLPTSARGTQFQEEVWSALRAIPYGQTRTYGQLAEQIGRPTAVRAVGLANGRNPLSIVVPCHRVVGADGSLTGYGGGTRNKQVLLELEGVGAGSVLF